MVHVKLVFKCCSSEQLAVEQAGPEHLKKLDYSLLKFQTDISTAMTKSGKVLLKRKAEGKRKH